MQTLVQLLHLWDLLILVSLQGSDLRWYFWLLFSAVLFRRHRVFTRIFRNHGHFDLLNFVMWFHLTAPPGSLRRSPFEVVLPLVSVLRFCPNKTEVGMPSVLLH